MHPRRGPPRGAVRLVWEEEGARGALEVFANRSRVVRLVRTVPTTSEAVSRICYTSPQGVPRR